MNITYHYEPEVYRFWIGASDGKNFNEFALRHNMTVDEVIECLKECQNYVRKL